MRKYLNKMPKLNTSIVRSELQLLITGCYRSGTEFSSILINNHPDIVVTMYTTSFMRYCYNKYNPIKVRANYTKLLKDSKKRIKIRWNKNLNILKILDICNKEKKVTYQLLYDLMMSDLFLNNNTKIWGEKTQLVWRQIPNFLRMFPSGKSINIIRDPRSVLASFKKSTYNPEPAYLGAVFNCYDSMQKSLLYSKKYKKNFLFIRYEDIASNPKRTLKKIYKFLNLSHNHNLLNNKEWLDANGEKFLHNSAFIKKNKKLEKFDVKESISRWKKNLNKSEIAFCQFINKDLMNKFNYKTNASYKDFNDLLPIIFKDKKISRYFINWLTKKIGIQEFPNNPLDPKNWEENN